MRGGYRGDEKKRAFNKALTLKLLDGFRYCYAYDCGFVGVKPTYHLSCCHYNQLLFIFKGNRGT